MIGLIQNKTIYEYDIRSLILAFMLGEKIELTDHVGSIYDFILEVHHGRLPAEDAPEEEPQVPCHRGVTTISSSAERIFCRAASLSGA